MESSDIFAREQRRRAGFSGKQEPKLDVGERRAHRRHGFEREEEERRGSEARPAFFFFFFFEERRRELCPRSAYRQRHEAAEPRDQGAAHIDPRATEPAGAEGGGLRDRRDEDEPREPRDLFLWCASVAERHHRRHEGHGRRRAEQYRW